MLSCFPTGSHACLLSLAGHQRSPVGVQAPPPDPARPHAHSRVLRCTNALEVQLGSVLREEGGSFAPFCHFRGVGSQWEIADP